METIWTKQPVIMESHDEVDSSGSIMLANEGIQPRDIVDQPNEKIVDPLLHNPVECVYIPEIFERLAVHLSSNDILNCRLVSRSMNTAATRWLKCHLYIRFDRFKSPNPGNPMNALNGSRSVQALMGFVDSNKCTSLSGIRNFELTLADLEQKELRVKRIMNKFFRHYGVLMWKLNIHVRQATMMLIRQVLSPAMKCVNLKELVLSGGSSHRSVWNAMSSIIDYLRSSGLVSLKVLELIVHPNYSPVLVEFQDGVYPFSLEQFKASRVKCNGLWRFLERNANTLKSLSICGGQDYNLLVPKLPVLRRMELHTSPCYSDDYEFCVKSYFPSLTLLSITQPTSRNSQLLFGNDELDTSQGLQELIYSDEAHDTPDQEMFRLWTHHANIKKADITFRAVPKTWCPNNLYHSLRSLSFRIISDGGDNRTQDKLLTGFDWMDIMHIRHTYSQCVLEDFSTISISALDRSLADADTPRHSLRNFPSLQFVQLEGQISEVSIMFCLRFLKNLETLRYKGDQGRFRLLGRLVPIVNPQVEFTYDIEELM